MRFLSDRIVDRLREVSDYPDLSGTKYRLVGHLGRGGMGSVYLVEDLELGREAALKMLSDPDPDEQLSERLQREARHLARLEHPNIVPVHDVGRLGDGRVFYVMKYIRGERLDDWRRGAPGRGVILRMFRRICEAVAFAHARGVVHRDLKPENVMTGSFGEAVVMDWGVAKALRRGGGDVPGGAGAEGVSSAPAGVTAHGTVMGTPAYMAPEQARGEVERIDERTDVYALGALLHFLLCGSAPSNTVADTHSPGGGAWAPAAPLREIDPGIPRPLESICRKAMAEKPAERYSGATAVAEDIDRFLDGRPVAAHPETWLERGNRFVTRYHFVIILILAYLIMRLAVLFLAGR